MRKLILQSFVSLSLALGTVQAFAYDVDTHFYGTYSMARFAGIRHEVALKIALGAQWMDESFISDPMSMIISADGGVKKRRLLHFPGSRLANKLTVDKLNDKGLGLANDPTTGQPLKSFTETEADHPFATEMFTEGLREGNLMKAAAGLHTLEDSFAHAGTIAELGHAHFWHHPDRPFVDAESIEKYFKMTRSVLKALVAMRALLPESAIDTSVKFSADQPNYLLGGDQLADLYAANPVVRYTITKKILNEPEFVQFAINDVFKSALAVGYVNAGYEPYIKALPGEDTYSALARIAQELPDGLVNVQTIVAETGYSTELDADYVMAMGGAHALASQIVLDVLRGLVPRPLSVYHRFEKEKDGTVWAKELNLRETNMRGLIYSLYKTDIYFVKNNTSDETGFLKELRDDSSASPVLPQLPSGSQVELVTYSLAEKRQFNDIIFSFLFPKTAKAVGGLTVVGNLIATGEIEAMGENGRVVDVAKSKALQIFEWGKTLVQMRSLKQNVVTLALEDLRSAHMVPNRLNKFYAFPTLVQKKLADGTFKKLLTDEQVAALVAKN